MSIISIHITKPTDLPTMVRAIRPITEQSIADIKSCLENNRPIYEQELFLNDYAGVAGTLRQLVHALNETDAEFTIREFGAPIGATTLFCILAGCQITESLGEDFIGP